jgi:hypothetical protein
MAGICEPSGFCSFSDLSCVSGRRYGRYARFDLCDACVLSGDGGLVVDGQVPDGALAMAGCGGTRLLRDDFDDGVMGLDWGRSYQEGAVTTSETGGKLVITLASGAAGSTYGGLVSSRFYNLVGDEVAVRVTDMVDTSTDAEAYLEVREPGGNLVRILQRHGDLHFQKRVAGTYASLATIKFNALLHDFWRIREDRGDLFWETSGNGENFVVRAQAPAPFEVTTVEVQLGAGTASSIPNPGSVGFDELNVRAPLGRFCKASSFSDDFDDGVRAITWSRTFAEAGCSVVEKAGQVVLSVAPGTRPFCAYATSHAYDLQDDQAVIRVPQMIDVRSNAHVYFHAIDRNRASVQIIQEGGELVARRQRGGDYQFIIDDLYSTTKHLWWRLREGGGTLFWETSSDGRAWTILYQELAPLDVSAVDIEFGLGVFSTGGIEPGALHVDDYNRAP